MELSVTGASTFPTGLESVSDFTSPNDLIIFQIKATQPNINSIGMLCGLSTSGGFNSDERIMIARDTSTLGAYRCLVRDGAVNESDTNTGIASGKDVRIKYTPSTGDVLFEYWNGSVWTDFGIVGANIDLGTSVSVFLFIANTTDDAGGNKVIYDDFFISDNDYLTQYPV